MKTHFSAEAIIGLLVRRRLKLARRIARGRLNPRTLSGNDLTLCEMLPPRRSWHRYRSKPQKGENSAMIPYRMLLRATIGLWKANPTAKWAKRLADFIKKIQKRALKQKAFAFGPLKIFAQQKAGKPEYRPLVAFNLEDTVINSLTAKYLMEQLDPLFDDSSFAFRCHGPGKAKRPDHHDALRKVVDIRNLHGSQGLFVAEADIKGFFDCLDHTVILKCFDVLRKKAKQAGRPICPRAVEILKALLRGYNFQDCVLARDRELLPPGTNGVFKWPEEDLERLHFFHQEIPIGIPQGGALSMVIANIVLHQVDAALRALPRREEFTYVRYCDDMLILSPDKALKPSIFS